MGVDERGTRGRPDVLKDVDVLEAQVAVEVVDPLAPGGEHFRDGGHGQFLQRAIAVGRLDHDLVRADAGEVVINPGDRAAGQRTLDFHRRITVRHDPHAPARLVGL
jgi:hypothetical protein